MLEYKNISLAYDRKAIMKDISLSFKKGTITTIIGPNGSGKTTLVQALNGGTKVTSGEIRIDDQDYLSLSPSNRAKKISFLPQTRGNIPSLPAKVLVEHGRFPYLGFTRKMNSKDREIVRLAMEKANISDYQNQSVDTLSGGVRQRVFIAMQLAQDCDYLISDEPTTYLDLPSQRAILSIYADLKKQGKCIILVLHDLAQALEISDNLIVVDNKKIAAVGSTQEILEQHIIERIFDVTLKDFSEDNQHYYFFK